MENLKAIHSSVIGADPGIYTSGIAYKEREAVTLKVVAVHGDKVIFWSNGYRGFSEYSPGSCSQTDWIESHPPGFYQIPANQVWLHLPTAKYNTIPEGQEDSVAAVGNGTSSLNIRCQPNEEGRPAYIVKNNAELLLASTEKIPANDESGNTYYKIIFKGNTPTQYMNRKEYCYVNSLFVDIDMDGADKPADLTEGMIVNVSGNSTLNLYSEKSESSEAVGRVTKNANVRFSPSESDKEWTTVWFSGQKCYIKTEYVREGYYIEVENTGNIHIKDIVDGQYVVAWDPVNTDANYTVSIVTTDDEFMLGKAKSYWLYVNQNYAHNEFTVDNSYFKDGSKDRDNIYIRVKAKSGDKVSTLKLSRITVTDTVAPAWDKASGVLYSSVKDTYLYHTINKSVEMQLATDKKFTKDVQTNRSTSTLYKFSNLEPDTTYYLRMRYCKVFETQERKTVGVYGPWSEVKTVKTEKAPVYEYIEKIEIVDIINDQYLITWNEVPDSKGYKVVISEYSKTEGPGDVIYSNDNCKTNTLLIKKKWLKKSKDAISVKVEVNKKVQYTNKKYKSIILYKQTQTALVEDMQTELTLYAAYVEPTVEMAKYKATFRSKGGQKNYEVIQVQVSTSKKFDNAETYEADPRGYVILDNLTPNRTYYYKYRYARKVDTQFGDRLLYGKWSKKMTLTTPKR